MIRVSSNPLGNGGTGMTQVGSTRVTTLPRGRYRPTYLVEVMVAEGVWRDAFTHGFGTFLDREEAFEYALLASHATQKPTGYGQTAAALEASKED